MSETIRSDGRFAIVQMMTDELIANDFGFCVLGGSDGGGGGGGGGRCWIGY